MVLVMIELVSEDSAEYLTSMTKYEIELMLIDNKIKMMEAK